MAFVAGNRFLNLCPLLHRRHRFPFLSHRRHHTPLVFSTTKTLLSVPMTVSVHPLTRMRATFKACGVKTTDDNQEAKITTEMDTPSNSFLCLLYGFGILFSGLVIMVGALYALAQKEKSAAVTTMETGFLCSLLSSLNQLKDQFELGLDKARKNQVNIVEIVSEKVNLLKHELPNRQKNLAKFRIAASGNLLQELLLLCLQYGFGILFSGLVIMVGALYALAQKEKSAAVTTMETGFLCSLLSSLNQLKDQFELGLDKARKNQVNIVEIVSEKVNLLKHELPNRQKNLAKFRIAASGKRLNESNEGSEELEVELSNLSSKLTEAKELARSNLNEAKLEEDVLDIEVITAKEQLKENEEELQSKIHELKTSLESRDSLQNPLFETYKMLETIAENLNTELTSSLLKNIQALCNEAQRSLAMDVEVATKLLDEMNQNSLIICGELERVKSLNSGLEKEKKALSKSLTEHRNAIKESQDNIADAVNLIMRLGKELEKLKDRKKELEEELAYAKGEMLHLHSQIDSLNAPVKNEQEQKDEGKTTITAKKWKYVRKKKGQQPPKM